MSLYPREARDSKVHPVSKQRRYLYGLSVLVPSRFRILATETHFKPIVTCPLADVGAHVNGQCVAVDGPPRLDAAGWNRRLFVVFHECFRHTRQMACRTIAVLSRTAYDAPKRTYSRCSQPGSLSPLDKRHLFSSAIPQHLDILLGP